MHADAAEADSSHTTGSNSISASDLATIEVGRLRRDLYPTQHNEDEQGFGVDLERLSQYERNLHSQHPIVGGLSPIPSEDEGDELGG